MKTVVEEVVKDFYILRLNDMDTSYFEAIWKIPEGITYNAFVLVTEEGAVLFDTWKYTYAEEFIENLRSIVDPRDVSHLVVHHMEQDHSGAIPLFLRENGNKAVVLGHKLTGSMLEAFYSIKPRFRAVRDGEKLTIGDKTITFIHTPWLHWPETIMSYLECENYRVLLSGDAFGGYSIPSTLFDDSDEIVSEYLYYVKKYVATIIGFYSNFILKNIGKIKSQNINPQIIAPAHGLVFRNKPEKIINYYTKLAEGRVERGKIVIVYSSMYGSVKKAISFAVEELKRKKLKPLIYGFTDVNQPDIGEIISDILDSEALIIGVSAYEGGLPSHIASLLNVLVKKIKAKKRVLIISSYGWGNVAAAKVSKRLDQAGHRVVASIEFRGQPKNEDVKKIKQGLNLLLE